MSDDKELDPDFLPIELDHSPTHSLPHARTVGSAKIEPGDIQKWKNMVTPTFLNYFKEKYEDLRRKYEALVREFYVNKLIYEASTGFEPVIGHIYYLYVRERDGVGFLSLVSPQEAFWSGYIGKFRLTTQYSWEELPNEENENVQKEENNYVDQ